MIQMIFRELSTMLLQSCIPTSAVFSLQTLLLPNSRLSNALQNYRHLSLNSCPPFLAQVSVFTLATSLGPTPCNLQKVTSRISEKFNFFTALTICMNNSCWHLRASCSITQLFSNQPYTINFLHVDPLKVSLQVGDDHHLDVDHHPGFPQLLVSGQVSQKLRGVNKVLQESSFQIKFSSQNSVQTLEMGSTPAFSRSLKRR